MARGLELVMSTAAACDSKADPVRVRSVRELFERLSAPDEATRFSALDAVRLSPQTALSFGLWQGRDVIDVLLEQAERARGKMEWFRWIGAMAAFRDRRVVGLFVALLGSENEGELLFALARYLQGERVETFRAKLVPVLMQNESIVRARAAAEAIGHSPCGSMSERLRIGLLQDTGVALPSFSMASAEWLAELRGPFRCEARLRLEREGSPALMALAAHWNGLCESSREWLIEWSSVEQSTVGAEFIRVTLRSSGSDRLSLAALRAAGALEALPDDLDDLIRPYLFHPDEAMRCAAAEAVRSGVDWRAIYENQSSVRMKEISLRRLAGSEGLRAMSDLLRHLNDADWRIRAAAADGLATLGAPAARTLIELLPEANETVRAAIGRVLLQFGDEELMDEFLRRIACGREPASTIQSSKR